MSINATQMWLRGTDGPGAIPASETASNPAKAQENQDFSFWDLLDMVNPLQHIPVISTIYREITGDTIKPAVQIAGSAILGGPIGLITSAMSAAFTSATGEEPVEMAFNTITGQEDSKAPAQAVQLAKAEPARAAEQELQKIAENNTAPAENAGQSNQDALMQLAADMRKASDSAQAAEATNFVKSLQTAGPMRAVMPKPAQQFMKPSMASSAVTGKPAGPSITIHPQTPAPANTAAPSVNGVQPVPKEQVAQQMMRALDAYQKMQTLSGADGTIPPQHLLSPNGL